MKMNNSIKAITLLLVLAATIGVLFIPAKVYAAADGDTQIAVETNDKDVTIAKSFAAAIVVVVVAGAGAISMGLAICKASDGAARQPEIAGKIQTLMMLGLVFVETAIIYALIVAIFIVFIL